MNRLARIIDRWQPELVLLIAAAFATRLWEVTRPSAVVFDEVYFKVFAGHYLDGHYFFDIHPPLGKLLLAGWASLAHVPVASLTAQATAAPIVRLLPAVAGALIIPVFWGILRRLGANRWFAFLGALALLADNALLVESRFILIDSMLLLFGLSCVYAYLVARQSTGRRRWLWLALSALAGGAAVSTKWTGLTALGLVGLVWLIDGGWHWTSRRLGELSVLLLIPLALYISCFWLHFHLLTKSGDGDAFMSTRFQATLVGSQYYDATAHLGFWSKFIELNHEMFEANKTLTATHPYGSRWYTWPLELRPIYYWEGQASGSGQQGNIYLLGNPIVWWGIILAAITGWAYAVSRRIKLHASTIAALSLLGLAYVMNLAPFLTVTRVMFLYHYFFAFCFSLAFVVLLWNDLSEPRHGHQPFGRHRAWVYATVAVAIVAGFIYFLPLSYGTPLSPAGLQAHMWLKSWR
jgi:dolichyl-phosphate-mannose-protein mannosyltransferase